MLILICLFAGTQFELNRIKPIEVPETEDYFVQNPLCFDVGANGNIYMVDGEAKVIFVWGPDGHFLRTVGKPGQGPGEFSFSGRGPAMGYVYSLGEQLYVFDGIQRKISIFDAQGNYLSSPELNLPRSRTSAFAVLSDDEFLFAFRRFQEDHFSFTVKTISAKGVQKQLLKQEKDNTVSFKMANGRPSNITIRAYNASTVVGVNAQNGQVIIGQSGEPRIEVYDRQGVKRQVEFKLVQRDVTAFDRDEFNESRADFRRRRPVKFLFPDKMPYFSKIFPLEGDRALLFNESPYTHRIEGSVVDTKEGKLLGLVSAELGEGGGLLNARGKLLRVQLNEDDEFEFDLVKLVTAQ